MDFRLPELGEGITDATVVNIAVKPGDSVKEGQPVLDVETDKSSMSLDAPTDGVVESLAVKPGQKIAIGANLMVIKPSGAANGAAKPAPAPAKAQAADAPRTPPSEPEAGSPQTAGSTNTDKSAARIEFLLPPLGEGIDGGTITEVKVKAGNSVKADQDIVVLETDKASMPVPIQSDAKIEEVRVKPGDKIKVGEVLAIVSGVREEGPSTKPTGQTTIPESPPPAGSGNAVAPKPRDVKPSTAQKQEGVPVAASPATRRFARELGVDISAVAGTSSGGRITVDDVKHAVRHRMNGTASAPTAAGGGGMNITVPPLPDFAKYGPVERKAVSKLRETIARNLTVAWHMVPMVTQYDSADITELEAGRKRVQEARDKTAPKVTMTVLIVKAVVATLKSFPNFNASFDHNTNEMVTKGYYNIGIAVDTEKGLVVPVIRDADKKTVGDIAKEISTLADKARQNKLAIDEMRGGSFTITNLGGIGGTAFSPIVNYPEVAILGLAKSTLQPVVRDGKIEPRLMMPLCLSYDHRVIDGADGARFTARLAAILSDPARLLMEG